MHKSLTTTSTVESKSRKIPHVCVSEGYVSLDKSTITAITWKSTWRFAFPISSSSFYFFWLPSTLSLSLFNAFLTLYNSLLPDRFPRRSSSSSLFFDSPQLHISYTTRWYTQSSLYRMYTRRMSSSNHTEISW